MAITGTSVPVLTATPGIAPYPKMTLACWLKMPATGTGTNYVFVPQMTAQGSQNFAFHYTGSPSPNGLGLNAGSAISGSLDCSGPSNVSNSVWHFLCCLMDDQGTAGTVKAISFYIDGALYANVTGASQGYTNNDPGSTDKIYAGTTDGGATIDYPMTWKRLLSVGEVSALWASGNGADPRVVASSQLVSFAQLNQGSGSIPDLVSSMSWVVSGGTFSVQPSPFQLPVASPPAQTMSTFPPPWEGGCGPADPALSASFASYSGSGYAANRRAVGEVGTINAGANTPVPLAGFPAQVRFYIGPDGMLHALSNQVGTDYVSTTVAGAPQQPPVYSPTK